MAVSRFFVKWHLRHVAFIPIFILYAPLGRFQIPVYCTVGGNAALGPRIYEGAGKIADFRQF
jgi:hypothetical protein